MLFQKKTSKKLPKNKEMILRLCENFESLSKILEYAKSAELLKKNQQQKILTVI